MCAHILVVDPNVFASKGIADRCCAVLQNVTVATERYPVGAYHSCGRQAPDVVVFESRFLTAEKGPDFARFLYSTRNAKLVALGDRFDKLTLSRADRIGVRGFLLRSPGVYRHFAWIVEQVLAGERIYQTATGTRVGRLFASQGSIFSMLTERELALLGELGTGASNEELAVRHGRSVKTFNNQRHSIMGKLEVHSSVDLMRKLIEFGFAHLDSCGRIKGSSHWSKDDCRQLELFWPQPS